MSLKKLALALFALACGGSSTNNNQDGGVDCKINCNYSDSSLDDSNKPDDKAVKHVYKFS